MANGHGGARTGSVRKKTALSDKIVSGNPGRAPLTKLQFDLQDNKLEGEDMPRVSEYLTQVTKNSQQNMAPQIYENTCVFVKRKIVHHSNLKLDHPI